MFVGENKLCNDKNGVVFFTGSPGYSFTDERGMCPLYTFLANWLTEQSDYKLFQTMIVGKANLVNVDIETISISGDVDISDSQVLQVWDDNGTRTIRFFRNVTDNKFSEYEVTCLKQYHSRGKDLKLEFRKGYDSDNFRKLKITFSTGDGKDTCIVEARLTRD